MKLLVKIQQLIKNYYKHLVQVLLVTYYTQSNEMKHIILNKAVYKNIDGTVGWNCLYYG